MKVAIGMLSLQKQLQQGEMCTIDFLKYAARLCVKGVDVVDRFIPKDTEGLLAVQTKLQETALEVVCYGVDYPKDKNDRARIKDSLTLAEQLGAPFIRLLGDLNHNTSASQAEALVLKALDFLLPELEEKDLVLCLENQGSPAFSSMQLANVLKQIQTDQVKVSFNAANCVLAGENPKVAFGYLQDQIAHIRACDLRYAENAEEQNSPLVGAILGLGLVPVDFLVESLQGQDYQGWIALEFAGAEDAFFGIEASLKNLHKVLYELANKGISASGQAWPIG